MNDDRIRDAAREMYGSDSVQIDEDARVVRADEGGHAWVQAWVIVENVEPGGRLRVDTPRTLRTAKAILQKVGE